MKVERYEFVEGEYSKDQICYLFTSIGKRKIPKVIVYSRIGEISDRIFYNLGFGDYDKDLKDFDDQVNSNNGDMRKVFNTVLFSVVDFFIKNPDFGIFVSGSDNFTHRKRIKAYCNFVNKNFNNLVNDYRLVGGFIEEDEDGDTRISGLEAYLPHRAYDAILVYPKNY